MDSIFVINAKVLVWEVTVGTQNKIIAQNYYSAVNYLPTILTSIHMCIKD